VAYCLINRKNN